MQDEYDRQENKRSMPDTGLPAPGSDEALSQDRLNVFNEYRGLLLSIAYRMLGSVADAEDMLQETFLRWQQSQEVEIESPRAYLVTIVSRLCINHLQSARAKREEYFGQWLPEPLVTQPSVSCDPLTEIHLDESVSMAFLLMLERLAPMERAVFLLHEVFDYKYSEIAEIVSQTEANCRKILSRARQHATTDHARFDSSVEQHDELLRRFLEASASGNMQGLLSLLSKEIIVYTDGGGKARAVPNLIYGPENVTRLILGAFKKFVPATRVTRMMTVNGRPGIVNYHNG